MIDFGERYKVEDPIKEAWEATGRYIPWDKYLENRNKEAKKKGFKSAYDQYYSNLAETSNKGKNEDEELGER